MKAMLAKENVDRDDLKLYLQDENYYFQPKHDGHRVLCYLGAGQVEALNRNGEPSQHQETLQEILQTHANTFEEPRSVVFDGELVNYNTYVVFDTPVFEDLVDLATPYSIRLQAAKSFIKRNKNLFTVVNGKTTQQKIDIIRVVEDMDAEGIIVRNAHSIYQPGRRSGDIIKCKFYKTVDLVVTETEVDGKEKFNFGAYDDDGELIHIGGTKQIYNIEQGDVIELRYLTQSDDMPPKLTQPVLMRRREDKAPKECTLKQFE